MRLGMSKRIKIRILPPHSIPAIKRLNKTLVFFLMVTTFAMGITYYYARICPLITSLASQRATQIISGAIEQTVGEAVSENGVGYEDFVTVSKDEDGNIQALYTNTNKTNLIKSKIVLSIQKKLDDTQYAQIKIPFGAIMGANLLAGAGPKINVSLMPIGYTLADFESSFSAAGINQTKHSININISVSFGMIMSTGSDNVEVKTSVPVAETIIVGEVPNVYVGK